MNSFKLQILSWKRAFHISKESHIHPRGSWEFEVFSVNILFKCRNKDKWSSAVHSMVRVLLFPLLPKIPRVTNLSHMWMIKSLWISTWAPCALPVIWREYAHHIIWEKDYTLWRRSQPQNVSNTRLSVFLLGRGSQATKATTAKVES